MSIILDGTSGINTPNTFAYKNLLIDAGFTINQRGYVSAATLASGAYGHDRWKAGASGGNYSFTQLASNTQITIASGKSLIQVVEDKNVSGTSYVLSWEGTAQARYAVNSATPAGSYAASPIVITGQTAGTTMSVEFNTGTLSKPQLELGAVATSFDQRAYSQELAMCQRYYQLFGSTTTAGVLVLPVSGLGYSTTEVDFQFGLPVQLRSTPSISATTVRLTDGVSYVATNTFSLGYSTNGLLASLNCLGLTGAVQNRTYYMTTNVGTTGYVQVSAEL
jgi:hypothetical protein